MMKWQTLLNSERPRKSKNKQGDSRVEFERDYDRAIFSTPVKRLQDKSQVHPLDQNDAVRTRLTHSLEVSSVAKGIASGVCNWMLKNNHIEDKDYRSIVAIASTCGLIHDLGNPPFGHAGEAAIQEWFKKHQIEFSFREDIKLKSDFEKFDGNPQTLRLISKLQILADYNGLNLTFGTLSASCKYTASSQDASDELGDCSKEKSGYFASEENFITEVRKQVCSGDARNPITFLVEAADDIVYSAADIEDGVKKGILSWSELKNLLIDEKSPKKFDSIYDFTHRILDIDDPSRSQTLPNDVYASAFRTAVISELVGSAIKEFGDHYEEIMSGEYRKSIMSCCDKADIVESLKIIGRTKIYNVKPTLKLELMGKKIIFDLMDIFWTGAKVYPIDAPLKTKKFEGKVAALLSENYCRVFKHAVTNQKELPEDYHRLRLLIDYVCGMTDTFATKLHAELNNGNGI